MPRCSARRSDSHAKRAVLVTLWRDAGRWLVRLPAARALAAPLGALWPPIRYRLALEAFRESARSTLGIPRDVAPLDYARRYAMYEQLVAAEGLASAPVQYLEFGVAGGDSLRWWATALRSPEARLIGFDTFTGLPEAWRHAGPGYFDQGAMPPAIDDPRVRFEVGLFDATLPRALERLVPGPRLVVHLDADLYSSTAFVLRALTPRLRAGDLLLFDEFADAQHEFRAYHEWIAVSPLRLVPVAAVNDFLQVAFRVV